MTSSKHGEINENTLVSPNTIFIDIFEIVNDKLYVLAYYSKSSSENIEVKINSDNININPVDFPQIEDFKYFEFNHNLNTDEKFEIKFTPSRIEFSKQCNFSRIGGYAKTKKYLSVLKGNEIIIQKTTTSGWLKQEFKTIFRMLKHPGKKSFIVIPFRLAYVLGYPFLKNKHIWFFMDRPEVADDNGIHLFKYAVNKDKDIKKYFILDKNNADFESIKKIGDVLPFQSIKHRYLTLFVENIVTSHPENQIIYPFWRSFPYFAGLLKSNNIFLQHGIIKDDISSWLNKTEMNLSFFLTSSPQEYESILQNNYHYDENIVKLLGLPRYDNLKNEENKKQILIMPSWRNYLAGKRDEEILESEFYKQFNSLLNNEKLIDIAKKYGYEIIFKPHHHIYKFIGLFKVNDYVKIPPEETKYQTLFNNGSLLITDYSSVAFDFAYLKKPILYYQYSEDYHFDLKDSYFKYDKMGFGEICDNEDDLVNKIEECLENDCQIKDKYLKRINEFFIYTDKNNCMRVYDAIKKVPLKD